MEDLACELIRMARARAATEPGRTEMLTFLRRLQDEVEATPLAGPVASEPVFTAREANALDGLAAALSLAADHAACIADRARVIASPPRHPRPPAR